MKYIIANWKMNKTLSESMEWVDAFTALYSEVAKQISDKKVIIAPSSTHIPILDGLNTENFFSLAAQDVSEYDKGAYTGYSGAFQIKDFVEYCIVGHSERKEPRDLVIKKRDICLKESLTPVVCFVESEDANKSYAENSLIAWEDPQNISKGGKYRDKDPKETEAGVRTISKLIPETALLIYGGSVNRQNITHLAKIKRINGVLVGNASLDPEHFLDIILNS
jgi:triosephosphate isomerase